MVPTNIRFSQLNYIYQRSAVVSPRLVLLLNKEDFGWGRGDASTAPTMVPNNIRSSQLGSIYKSLVPENRQKSKIRLVHAAHFSNGTRSRDISKSEMLIFVWKYACTLLKKILRS